MAMWWEDRLKAEFAKQAPSLKEIRAVLNSRFGLCSVGSKRVVLEREPDGTVVGYWRFPDFRDRLSQYKAEIVIAAPNGSTRVVSKPLGTYYVEHPDALSWDAAVADYTHPGTDPDDKIYNLWLGFKVSPTPPDGATWEKNCEHIVRNVCQGDKKLFAWLMNWCANMVQYPGEHAYTAVVLRGGQGTGKGHFAEKLLGSLWHPQQFLHLQDPQGLTGQFNGLLSGKVYVFADEATWGGDHRASDKLKGLITEQRIRIERKFLEPVVEQNAMHVVIASNNERPVRVEPGDRRFTIIEMGDGRQQDLAYFGALHQELDNGGREAFLRYLLELPVDKDLAMQPYATQAKAELATRSRHSVDDWWHTVLEEGVTIPDGSITDWPSLVVRGELYKKYLESAKLHREGAMSTQAFGLFLKKAGALDLGSDRTGTRRYRVKGEIAYRMAPLDVARAAWVKAMHLPEDTFADLADGEQVPFDIPAEADFDGGRQPGEDDEV